MKPGDLIRFWDYETGDGFVEGLVVEIKLHCYRTGGDEVPSAVVLYKDKTQIITLEEDDWNHTVL